jgi:hypothetical protein
MMTTTPEATVEASVLTAYLKPLVDKHTANELIKYEDLIQSNTSALLELKKQAMTTPAPVGGNANAVRDKLRSLHHEQVELYKAAAVEHIKAWADEAQPGDALPNWKFVPKSVLDAARQRVAERAAAAAAAGASSTAAGVILTAGDPTTADTVNDAVKNDAVEMEEGEEEGEVEGTSEQEDAEGAGGLGSETVDNITTEIAVEVDPPEEEEKPSKPEGKVSVTTEKGSNKGGILAKRHAARAGSKAGGGPAKKKPQPAKSPAPGGKRQPQRPPARKTRAAPAK